MEQQQQTQQTQQQKQEPEDPILLPRITDPTIDDVSNDIMTTSRTSGTTTTTATTTTTTTTDSHHERKKLLHVRNQMVKDALGNIGDYSGQIDVELNTPHGDGEMVYSVRNDDDEGDGDGDDVNNTMHVDNNKTLSLVASYRGRWEKGHWQGHGTQTLNNGDSFVGDFDQSKRTFGVYRWKEQQELPDKTAANNNNNLLIRKQRMYQGEFHQDGRPHGHGKYTWTTTIVTPATTQQDGAGDSSTNKAVSVSTYIGMFDKGQRNGHGVFTSSKLQYTGDWLDGKYHGYGVLKIPTKNLTYKGQFHHGARDGQGEECTDDGTILHQGLWRRDRPIKQGDVLLLEEALQTGDQSIGRNNSDSPPSPVSTVYQSPKEIIDGEGIQGMYKGIVEEALPSGVGTITYQQNHHPIGITQYEGFFDRGIRQGYGRAEFGNGDSYHGNWTCGIFEGSGEYLFADGRIYKGTWSKGLPHDKNAKFTWPNNDLFEGVYEHGHRKSGRLVFADGAYYDGEFYSPEGFYGGQGKLVTLMMSYEGDFRDGMFHGKGCLKKNSGFVIYDGNWRDGKALREDVMIAIPKDLLDVPLPPPDDDFGAFDDPPDTTTLLSALKRTLTPTLQSQESTLPTLSATILGTSSRFFESLASNFSSGTDDHSKGPPPHEDCKAVVDMPVSDAQDNPGR
jgi:hypothetical protein